MKVVDVAVIGGGLAGSACVRELTRLGVDAIAIERALLPHEKVCGGFLSPGAVAILAEMELLPALRAAGAVDIRHVRLRAGQAEVLVPMPSSGLSISRRTLDAVVADGVPRREASVTEVARDANGFRVSAADACIAARVVVDAAGKQSRFTPGRPSAHFGVQFYAQTEESNNAADVMEFWFFREGYGGVARVDRGLANACFLVHRSGLHRYRNRPGCRVTGPLTYVRDPFPLIAIGDAAGMIDPFCGEGMRHALDTARIAARVIARGLRRNESYDNVLAAYVREWKSAWAHRRRLAASVRALLQYPALVERGLGTGAARLMPTFWK